MTQNCPDRTRIWIRNSYFFCIRGSGYQRKNYRSWGTLQTVQRIKIKLCVDFFCNMSAKRFMIIISAHADGTDIFFTDLKKYPFRATILSSVPDP
jgi:hypothetical protein